MITEPNFEQQSAEAIRTLVRWCAVLSTALMVALGISIWGAVRISSDEQRTCSIQARALPAGHYLATSMSDIRTLLRIPPSTPAQREAVSHESPQIRTAVHNLTTDLTNYQTAEATQPQSRVC